MLHSQAAENMAAVCIRRGVDQSGYPINPMGDALGTQPGWPVNVLTRIFFCRGVAKNGR